MQFEAVAADVGKLDLTDPAVCLHGLMLAAGGLALAPLAIALVRRLWPERIIFFARWRFLHLFQAVLLFALAGPLVGMALHRLDPQPSTLALLSASTGVVALVVLLVVWQAKLLDPTGPRSLGLTSGGNLRAVAAGCASYALLLPTLLGLSMAWPFLWERLGGAYAPQEVAMGIAGTPKQQLWMVGILAILVVPFLEELLFRGFLQPLLVQNLGDRGGVAATAFAFALLHGGAAFLPIFALALILGALMLRTQRLSASFAVHALHNALMFVALTQVEPLKATYTDLAPAIAEHFGQGTRLFAHFAQWAGALWTGGMLGWPTC